MAKKVLVLGQSGTGKSRAAVTLDPKTTFLISPDMKGLPMKGSDNYYQTVTNENNKIDLKQTNFYKTRDPKIVLQLLKAISDGKPEITTVIIDTLTMLMFGEFMNTIKEKGFEKFNNTAAEIWRILNEIDNLRTDLTVIVTGYLDTAYDDQNVLRSSCRIPAGKILKEKVSIEELFDVVLYTEVIVESDEIKYYFITQNNGRNTCKSPEAMFDALRIPNDYNLVINKIKEYYT
jgi:hypothetical protein